MQQNIDQQFDQNDIDHLLGVYDTILATSGNKKRSSMGNATLIPTANYFFNQDKNSFEITPKVSREDYQNFLNDNIILLRDLRKLESDIIDLLGRLEQPAKPSSSKNRCCVLPFFTQSEKQPIQSSDAASLPLLGQLVMELRHFMGDFVGFRKENDTRVRSTGSDSGALRFMRGNTMNQATAKRFCTMIQEQINKTDSTLSPAFTDLCNRFNEVYARVKQSLEKGPDKFKIDDHRLQGLSSDQQIHSSSETTPLLLVR